jgi:GT2 family glycosyltransferase
VAHFAGAAPPVFAVHCQAIDLASGRVVGRGQRGRFARGFLRVHESFEPAPGAAPPFRSMFASGGSSMFDRRLFLELGGFDPIFAPFYYEDVELSVRAWTRGSEVHYEPASRIRHRFSSTIGATGRARIDRISQRNRLLLHWIHLQDRAWFVQHLAWLPVLALASLVTFRPTFALGLFDALKKLPAVSERRKRERAARVRPIRDVVRLCGAPLAPSSAWRRRAAR